jgi:signal transduction histidine kinase/ligand-binding sensor domain-containing protein
MIKGRFFQIAAALLTLAPTAFAQRYPEWRIYRLNDGMPENACVSVTTGPAGKVVARHINSDSISVLDGFSIASFASPEVGRSRVYATSSGQFWTATLGGLAEYSDNGWRMHPIPQIARLGNSVAPLVAPLIPIHIVRQGRLLILLPDQLLELSEENLGDTTSPLQLANRTGLQKFLGMTVARDGSLWISGPHGLEHSLTPVRSLKAGTAWQEFTAPSTLPAENFDLPIQDIGGEGFTCVAETPGSEQRCLAHFDGANWTVQTIQPASTQKIRGAWRGADGSTWMVTPNSILQFDDTGSASAESEEILGGHYFDVAVETNGVFWVASAEGLMRYSPSLWKSPRELQAMISPVPCLTDDGDAKLWFVSGGALHSLDNGRHQEHGVPRNFRPFLQSARVLLPLKNGSLLIDNGEQLFQFHPGPDNYNSLNTTTNERQHTLGVFRDGSVAIETTDGAGQKCRFEKYDGTSFQPFPTEPPDCTGNAFIETQNGDLWLGTDHGPYCYREGQWLTISNATVPAPVVSFVETASGKLWCATPDVVWEYSAQTWTVVHSGFDQINSMMRAHDGVIWIASNGGVQRFVDGSWIENSVEEGLPNANTRQVYEDHKGRIWSGTARGLSLFHPEADPDPPLTHIRKQPEGNTLPLGATVTMVFRGQDKWNYTPRDRLLYSYHLDQRDWTPYVDGNFVPLSDLTPGSHSLEVRAMDRNGNIEPKPARMTFAIALPWYMETRLVLISFAGMAAALFFAALAFNRHRKLLRSYAEVERKVAERTRELEITSRELVHSQKMNALGTLAAGIAHDFNNILSIIKGSAQIIEDNVGNTDKVHLRVDRIKTVVEQGAGIVKAMLGFSAGSSDEPVLCDLNAVVNETIQLLGDRFQRDAAVIFNPAPGLPQVPVVKEFVQQIVLNFVFNAAEAETTVRRKQIIIALRATHHLPSDLVLAPAPANKYVLISVQDFGCGIQPENLSRIFEPFFTTKAMSARRGTGLGLSMVYELSRKLAAGLSVESIVDSGSTFTLILPIRNDETVNS